MDLLVWTIAHGERVATVCEDGSIDGDPDLVVDLRERLGETVTVYRHGTVRSREGAPRVPIELRPGDRRYVVARVRALCEGESGYTIVDCTWR